MSILIALIIFSALVLFHEFGHFLLARRNGIVVTEFSLGMGPRILSKQIGETRYSWKLLPFGGSCAMLGEDSETEERGSFNSAPVLGRICVVAAGPVFNFILAFLLALIIVGVAGYAPAEVLSVKKGSAAEAAGLQVGDIITEYQGHSIDLGKDIYVYQYLNHVTEEQLTLKVKRDGVIHTIVYMPDVQVSYLLGLYRESDVSMRVKSLIPGMALEAAGVKPQDVITSINGVDIPDGEAYDAYIREHPLSDEPVSITYMRAGLTYEAKITPSEYRVPDIGFGYNVGCVKAKNPLEVVKYGLIETKYMIRTTLMSLRELIHGKIGMEELSGPVGVVDAIGTTYKESRKEGTLMVWMNMLNMAVMLSANLGVMNLLPIPALDGGRLLFLFLEALRRKPLNRQVEGTIHFAGLVLLMAFMVVIMYNDILKIF